MDRAIEDDLREAFHSRVAAPPHTPGLAETVLRRGRSARRRRRAASAAAVAVAVLGAGVAVSTFDRPDGAPTVAADLSAPPRVPLYTGQDPATLTTWTGDEQRVRPLEELTPVAARSDGSLVVTLPGERPGLGLLGPADGALRPLADDLDTSAVPVSADGTRAVVVTGRGDRRLLVEVEVATGRQLRVVPLTAPLLDGGEPVTPAAYSGDDVLLSLGEGDRQRSARWEAGDDSVVGVLDGYGGVLGGGGGRGAFRVGGDARCGTEVADLRSGGGRWRLCREVFAGFSPDGRLVLATNAVGDGLVVRDARDGDLVREVEVPAGARAYGWESSSTTLHTTVKGDRTVVVRCAVEQGRCRTVASFADVGRIPQPVPPVG